MSNIINRQKPQDNFGSVARILFIDITTMDRMVVEDNAIDIHSGIEYNIDPATWSEAFFIAQTAKFTEEDFELAGTMCVRQKLTFTVGKHYTSRWPVFDDMREREYAVLVIDHNRYGRLLGWINNLQERFGATFKKKSTTGEQFANRNEYECEFLFEHPFNAMPATYLTEPVVEPDLPGDDEPLPALG